VKSGKLELSERGVYKMPGYPDDRYFNLQNRLRRSIFSLETSLYLNGILIDPAAHMNISIPVGSSINKKNLDAKVKVNYESKRFYSVGVRSVLTPEKHWVQAYSIERSLCDIVRPHNRVDIQVIKNAYQSYVKRGNKNIEQVIEFACLLGVEKRVRTYLEILL
jgi:hypothetical protein